MSSSATLPYSTASSSLPPIHLPNINRSR
jgi:hypothetical protein